jgi:hypothetical protein
MARSISTTLSNEAGIEVPVTITILACEENEKPTEIAVLIGDSYHSVTRTGDDAWTASGEPSLLLNKILKIIDDSF